MGFSAFWYSHQCHLNHEDFLKNVFEDIQDLEKQKIVFISQLSLVVKPYLKRIENFTEQLLN